MRLIIDGWSLHPPKSGIGVYTFELLSRLSQREAVDGLEVYMDGAICSFDNALKATEVVDEAPGPDDRASLARRAWRQAKRLPAVGPFLSRSRGSYLKRKLERNLSARPFVFHAPNFVAPIHRGSLVVTIHDLSFLRYPGMHTRDRLDWIIDGVERSVKDASRIIVPSEFTRRELLHFFDDLDEERVVVTALGAGDEYRSMPSWESKGTLEKYSLAHKRFCFFAGNAEPRKNLLRLLDAWGKLSPDLARAYPLVLAGPGGWLNHEIFEKAERLEEAGLVRTLGFVAADDLPTLMAGARLFIYPSLYEGFGLPVLEAMSSGVPVITSKRASLPEITGSSASLIDPTDVDEMVFEIQRVLEDDRLSDAMSEQGLQRAQRFCWDDCVDRTVEAYRQAWNS
ncbi:glycosyltransferase family 1 protein [Mesorhizobium sp. CAU 1741]|uniref:glycosyltransferase family 4 protein n=1 Tax=Mesorhizobium sp. CAU 1741 TaxID=3140366 RepID=UPI00325AF07D